MRRLLIAGAGGFLGRRLLREASSRFEVVARISGRKARIDADEVLYADLPRESGVE
jgi:nucleoside-diphosphate-sugar epimerase